MSTQLNSSGITFPDSTTQTTAATIPSFYSGNDKDNLTYPVGSYLQAWAIYRSDSIDYDEFTSYGDLTERYVLYRETVYGGHYIGSASYYGGNALTGTWMALGYIYDTNNPHLFQRVA